MDEIPECRCYLRGQQLTLFAKALRLLEVKEEKVLRKEEYPRKGLSVPCSL